MSKNNDAAELIELANTGHPGGKSTLLERRLYELARKHVEDQQEWIAREESLYVKSGSKTTKSDFNRLLMTIVADNKIPGYSLSWYESGAEEKQVRFVRVQSIDASEKNIAAYAAIQLSVEEAASVILTDPKSAMKTLIPVTESLLDSVIVYYPNEVDGCSLRNFFVDLLTAIWTQTECHFDINSPFPGISTKNKGWPVHLQIALVTAGVIEGHLGERSFECNFELANQVIENLLQMMRKSSRALVAPDSPAGSL